MDRWLKSRSSKPNYSSNQQTENSEINDGKPFSILKEPVKDKTRKTCKYDKGYLKFVFSWTRNEEQPIPLCVICFENLTNENMKPSILRQTTISTKMNPSRGDNKNILEVLYRVSLLIANRSAARTIGETLIKSVAKILAEVMIGHRAKQTFDCVPLSNNSDHRRIIDMSNHVKQMLLSDISQSCYYALRVDESTDTANFANIMAFVRYEKDQEIHENFLFCQLISAQMKQKVWSKLIKDSLQEFRMLPQMSYPHREALATRKMPADLQKVLAESVKFINYIKSRPLNARLFN
ncbi:hypothetical protein ILUMI_26870 [Ignelater luminosus]|uniref:DUF4371 domain-containing protein n=1 Tax=Ignelater luminosus TaxID=2038154 RepID=A0A8K0FVU3_IGNLU|nr:hypothetical protein ILUMI_26870 [Ignelater luminosus]